MYDEKSLTLHHWGGGGCDNKNNGTLEGRRGLYERKHEESLPIFICVSAGQFEYLRNIIRVCLRFNSLTMFCVLTSSGFCVFSIFSVFNFFTCDLIYTGRLGSPALVTCF